jgi:uncharacterized Zn finger protein (UPF0148 family)
MNMFHCPQCGAVFKEDAKFCHICGYKIPEETVQENVEPAKKSEPVEENINVETFTDVKSDEIFNVMKSGNIFNRAINIMFKPRQEWEVVAQEKPRIPMIILGYALIFSIIPIIALMIDNSFFGRLGIGFHFSIVGTIYGFFHGILFAVASLTSIIVGAVIINSIAPGFKTEKNLGRAIQLTAYSFTPMFFAAALYLIPYMSFMVILVGLYGIFLVLMGQPVIMKTPKNTQVGYFFTTIGIVYAIFFTVYWTSSAILAILFRGIYGLYWW